MFKRRSQTATHTCKYSRWIFTLWLLSLAYVPASLSQENRTDQPTDSNPDKRPLLIMGHIEFPPFFYTDTKGQSRGHLIDLARRLSTFAGYRFEARSFPPRRAGEMLAIGKIDIWLGRPSITEHQHAVLVSETVVDHINLRAYSTRKQPRLITEEDLIGKKVVILRGYSYGGWASYITNPQNKVSYLSANNHRQALQILIGRNMDYLLDYKLPLEDAAQKSNAPPLHSTELFRLALHILVSKQHQDAEQVLQKLEEAFVKIKRGGKLRNSL